MVTAAHRYGGRGSFRRHYSLESATNLQPVRLSIFVALLWLVVLAGFCSLFFRLLWCHSTRLSYVWTSTAVMCYVPSVCDKYHKMKTQARSEDQQKALDAARVLAEFANLEAESVDRFKAEHRDFVPQAWWNYRPTLPYAPFAQSPQMQWQINQKLLRDAWSFEFDMALGSYVHLLTSVFDPSEPEPPLFGRRYRPAFVAGLDIGDQFQDELPYYLAVKWLGSQGWRAKQCMCGRRFIAENSNAQFCSSGLQGKDRNCFWEYRKQYKRTNWEENKASTNERRRREYQLKKKRSRRAKGKTIRQK